MPVEKGRDHVDDLIMQEDGAVFKFRLTKETVMRLDDLALMEGELIEILEEDLRSPR